MRSDGFAEVCDALAECVVKAIPSGSQGGEFDHVLLYRLPTGPIHKAIPLLEQFGVVVRPGFDGRQSCNRSDVGEGAASEASNGRQTELPANEGQDTSSARDAGVGDRPSMPALPEEGGAVASSRGPDGDRADVPVVRPRCPDAPPLLNTLYRARVLLAQAYNLLLNQPNAAMLFGDWLVRTQREFPECADLSAILDEHDVDAAVQTTSKRGISYAAPSRSSSATSPEPETDNA